ncbi:MAG TPA: hypothetical protein VE914_20190 [Candidatus Angelobacter sp.]|nr:hypothetical protein [Candidatus Angelobacter sp.]
MQSVDESALGAARVTRPDRASKLVCMGAAVIASLGLAACAEPSPKVQAATADASQPATADSSAAGQPAANESATAATEQAKVDSPDATASGDKSTAVETAENAAAPASPPTAPAAPEATSGNTASAPTPPAADAPSTAAVQQAGQPAPAGGAETSGVLPPGSGLATGRPYVVIRFTESSVDYEKALSEAVKRAVARKPNLAFDLVAVTPRAGTAEELADLTDKAHAEADSVMKSLSALGIGPERVSMMTWTGQPTDVNEIRLYIR